MLFKARQTLIREMPKTAAISAVPLCGAGAVCKGFLRCSIGHGPGTAPGYSLAIVV